MSDERRSEERPDIEVLMETIDRNSDSEWEDYRESFEFTLVDDATVRVSRPDEKREVDHLVELADGRAARCDCFTARRPSGDGSCRHVRAVDAHPRL